MTTYPAKIDNSITLPISVDNSTPIKADVTNRLRNAVLAIEQELGVKPGGIYATVKARLDAMENIINNDLVMIGGDIGGTTTIPLVIGLQGRLLADTAPLFNQTLTWNGLSWSPSFTSTQTAVTEMDIAFISGAQLSGSNTPSAIGGRIIDMEPFIPVLGDGRLRVVRFYADVEVAGGALLDGYVELYDVTHDVIVTDTDFHFTNDDVAEVSSPALTVGVSNGDIRDDEPTYYEIRLWKDSSTGSDRAICHSARLTISYE